MIKRDFDKALDLAIAEAKTTAADYLPGWSGPSDDRAVTRPRCSRP